MFLPILVDWLMGLFYPKTHEAIVLLASGRANLGEIMKTKRALFVVRNDEDMTFARIQDNLDQRRSDGEICPQAPHSVSVVIATPKDLGFVANNADQGISFEAVLIQGLNLGFNICHHSTQLAWINDPKFQSDQEVLFFAQIGANGEVRSAVYSNGYFGMSETKPRENEVLVVELLSKFIFEVT
jgi:hypothetical protein